MCDGPHIEFTCGYVESKGIPQFPVGIDDFFDVKSELEPVIDRWKHIGLALRLDPDRVKRIERENRDLEDCLTEVLTLWLKRNYNTERFGEPSWEMLARAVGHRSGGNDPALAREIAKRYICIEVYDILNSVHGLYAPVVYISL